MKTLNFVPFIFALILVSCGEKEKKVENTIPNVPTLKNSLKIAFYHQDSLKEGYTYYAEMDSMVKAKQIRFQKTLENKQIELQKYVMTNEELAKSGQLSGFDVQKVQQEAQRREQALYVYQQDEGGKLDKETAELLDVITKRIEAAGKKYCEKHGIDLLLIHGAGGQINYIKNSMNVTKEFIAYLNQHQEEIEKNLGTDNEKGKKK